ncbi:MAG: YebC/PmpR family DNA-binding transcriptional regulator [Megasphaera sp.]|jgi:YebC/PmpR family DNA-binding regulatory protein|nr:YebC/PmpR family DNA-binding transcriptional regulator [Megasphaera sp.]MCH4187414.1 YebC/PmpR family DNA-binding transcriptional regulator [Megasphaera sp.]MCH4217333.1 YebC/PmpR family DNA-binding transcriptional regulator [Megasphaera sp.]
MSGHSKWANIKRKKGKNDAIRGKITTKIGREITIAVRMGGTDPVGNMRLKLALQKAKENNIPKDNIKRAIQKGAGAAEGQSYEEIIYEGYGPAGVAVTVNVLTDNRNRAAAAVRHEFAKHGGNLGETGCVGWMFNSKGIFVVSKDQADEDKIMEITLEAGADDVKTGDEEYEIITAPDAFDDVEKALVDNNIEMEHAQITQVPDNTIKLTMEDAKKLDNLVDALDEIDDVQDVYHNGDMPDDMDED